MTTATRPAPPVPDVADVLAAGRLYPMRDPFVPLSHTVVAELLIARREFWLAAAASYAENAATANKADDWQATSEFLSDSRRCLDAARLLDPDQPPA